MIDLPDEGDIITIENGFLKRFPEKVKLLEHIQTLNPFTGEVECHHIVTCSVRGNYEQLVRVERVMLDT